MRYARKQGFAGVPGAILDGDDIRRAASFFAEEDRKTAGSVNLSGLPATSSDASCATCAPASGGSVRLSDRIAAKLFREMGAGPLAAAAVDGRESPLMARAGALAAGLSESLKLRTDKIAVLSSLTSPMFAKAVDRTALKLHGLKGNDRFASALTLGFLMGATDEHARRPTFYADAYRKAAQGMTDALSGVTDPALRPMVAKVVAILGTTPRQQTPRQLAGLGQMPTAFPAPNLAPFDSMVSSGVIGRSEADVYSRFAENAASWRRDVTNDDTRDIGTATRSPASLKIVDTYPALGRLWDMLVYPVQTTSPKWKNDKPFGNDSASAIAFGKRQADAILSDKGAGRPVSDANLIAAWLIRNYGDRIKNYTNAGIGPMEWDRFGSVPWTPILAKTPNYEGQTWTQRASRFVSSGGMSLLSDALGKFGSTVLPQTANLFISNNSTRWSGDVFFGANQNQTNTGLTTYLNIKLAPDAFTGVTSTEFGRQCMIAYYFWIEQTKDAILAALTNGNTPFPISVGCALALARRDALERTGQTGSYGGDGKFEWIPNVNGEEQVPAGTAAYADWFADAGPNKDKPRWEAIEFVKQVYRSFYKREPTRHAIGWYGRMGYGLGEKWYDLAPNDVVKFAQAITGTGIREATDLRRSPEDARLAGSELPESAAKDRSSWFAVIGSTVSGIGTAVIGAMSKGLDKAVALLCLVFKWLFGESAGGVVCSIIGTIIKFMVGAMIGATAALFAIVKAISLFINELMKGETIKAFKVLMLGINQSIFFVLGSGFAAYVGGDQMPFLKSEEAAAREKARAAGLNPDDAVLPSLESLAEAMTNENPFFIFDVIFSVIDIATSAGALLLKAAGRLTYALCPVMGYVFAGKAMKAIKESKDPDVAQWKKLTLQQVRTALTAISKIIAAVVMGILVASQALKMLKDPWKRYVVRKGGTASAVMGATGYVAKRIDSELLLFFAMLIPAAKNGFKDSDPAFQLMKEALKAMWEKVPQIIIGFITDELLTEDERKQFQPVIDAIADTAEQAKKAYETAKDILFPSDKYDPVPDPLPKDPEKRKEELKKREDGSKALLPVFALAAGLVVGFMFAGGSDGA